MPETVILVRNRGEAMRIALMLAGLVALSGCQATAPGRSGGAGDAGDALTRLAAALPGEYDNHEQVAHSKAEAAPSHVLHDMLLVEHGREGVAWLWRLRAVEGKPMTSVWFMRAQAGAGSLAVRIVPYRPLDTAAAEAAFADPAKPFRFRSNQWAELAPCALDGTWDASGFGAAASVDACSALLPGLGEAAALLPLRLSVQGDMLRVATFSDTARGADALELARRVRWFDGWAAINGGGPQAKAINQDWHLNRDLRLSSEGGRVSLRWRDGAASGYSLQLERTSYPERKLAVLQLDVIDDHSGEVLTYAWTDPDADAIGFNLGWLQVGLARSTADGKGR
jgi:hypothetical protein